MNKLYLAGRYKDNYIYTERRSGVVDRTTVYGCHSIDNDTNVALIGSIRSRNLDGKVELFIEPKIFCKFNEQRSDCEISGHICKKGNYRKSRNARLIDVIVVVESDSHTDYIPCIFWNKLADDVEKLGLGSEIHVKGRFQSRQYTKEGFVHTTNEVSVLEFI